MDINKREISKSLVGFGKYDEFNRVELYHQPITK